MRPPHQNLVLSALRGLLAAGALLAPAAAQAPGTSPPKLPNVVVLFIDDMGYADIGPFGSTTPTPNLDRMAKEGTRFTDFAVSSAVCSASRSALLTGCYHRRIGISGALGPNSQIGIGDGEMTIAQLCKQKGYATACFGKWHLGHHPKFLPLQHGFDEYFGLPYSNDMWPLHPDYVKLPPDAEHRKRGYPNLPLIEGNKVVDNEVTGEDQAMLTTWYTEHAVSFIERHQEQPFFLYVPHSMVHVPLFVSDKFKGKSGHGLFGDVVMEVDWSVGQILDKLKSCGLDDNTLVLFTSDNGPWLSYGNHAGSAGPLREGKGTEFEGGIREPTIVRWPGHVPAGATCDEFAATIDILPTIAKLIGGKLPDHKIDGLDISPLLFGQKDVKSPHESYCCYYGGGQLQAIRDARYKLQLPHKYATLDGREGGRDGSPAPYTDKEIGLSLYDLKADPGETTDIKDAHPDVVARLQKLAQAAREDLGDTLTKTEGKGLRAPGKLTDTDERLRW